MVSVCRTVVAVSTLFAILLGSPASQTDVTTNSDGTNYLLQYGYLVPQDPKTGALRSQKSVQDAIKQFQRNAGIPQTGILDDETKKTMSLPRCGVPDNVGIGRGARKKRYTLQGSKWAKHDLSYRISSYSGELEEDETGREVKRALKVWSEVTPLTFTYSDSDDVDIDIRFATGAHGDGNPFDGRGRTLAHAFFPQYGGNAHFDDDEPWTINVPYGVNLFQVAAHEFGHSIGLGHSDVSDALMAPFYRGFQRDFQLDSDDIEAVQELYGPPIKVKPGIRPPIRPPTKGPVINIPSICRDPALDAITRQADGFTYVFKGKHYYRLNGYGIDSSYPRKISEDFKGVEGPIDAALHWENGYTFLFKGERYWKFHNLRLIYSRKIKEGFRGVPDNIDAAFIWGGNGKTYFIKGNKYWRYSDNRVDSRYPKPLSVWRGIPSHVNTAFKWKNGRTYFFSGRAYYRFHDSRFRVDDDYPRDTGNWWLGCPDKGQIEHFDNINKGKDSGINTGSKSNGNLQNEAANGGDQFLAVVTPYDGTHINNAITNSHSLGILISLVLLVKLCTS